MKQQTEVPQWAKDISFDFKRAAPWLKWCAKSCHFAPTHYAVKGTGNDAIVLAWNSRRIMQFDMGDKHYAENS